jgi:hypothetical protein
MEPRGTGGRFSGLLIGSFALPSFWEIAKEPRSSGRALQGYVSEVLLFPGFWEIAMEPRSGGRALQGFPCGHVPRGVAGQIRSQSFKAHEP